MPSSESDSASEAMMIALDGQKIVSGMLPVLAAGLGGRLRALNPVGDRLLGNLSADGVAALSALAGGDVVTASQTISVETDDGHISLEVAVLPSADPDEAILVVRDASAETAFREALIDSRRRYKDFIELSTDFTWETGADGRFTYVSPNGGFGFAAEPLLARDPGKLIINYEGDGDSPFNTRHDINNVELWVRRADNQSACVIVSARPIFDSEKRWLGARGVCRDVTAAREREATLAQVQNRERLLTQMVRAFQSDVSNERNLEKAAQTMSHGLMAERCLMVRFVSVEDRQQDDRPLGGGDDAQTFVRFSAEFGDAPKELVDMTLDAIAEGAGLVEMVQSSWQVMAAPTRFNGRINGALCLWRHVNRGAWTDDERLLTADSANQIGIIHEQMAERDRVVHAARTDALTGLLNRGAFIEALTRQMRSLERTPHAACLLYIDLDNFKALNDTFGHAAGDECLLSLKAVLLENTRPNDLVARLGGDEFSIWMDGASAEIATRRARAMQDSFVEVMAARSVKDRPVSLSVGIAEADPAHLESVDAIINRADNAMYNAKQTHKGSLVVAEPANGGA